MAKCSYGANCYRKSAEHFETYAHPRALLERRVSGVAAEHSADAPAPTSSTATPPVPAADRQPAGAAACRDVVPVFGAPGAPVFAGSSKSLTEPPSTRVKPAPLHAEADTLPCAAPTSTAPAAGKLSRSSTGGDTRIDPVVLDSDEEEEQVRTEGVGD